MIGEAALDLLKPREEERRGRRREDREQAGEEEEKEDGVEPAVPVGLGAAQGVGDDQKGVFMDSG